MNWSKTSWVRSSSKVSSSFSYSSLLTSGPSTMDAPSLGSAESCGRSRSYWSGETELEIEAMVEESRYEKKGVAAAPLLSVLAQALFEATSLMLLSFMSLLVLQGLPSAISETLILPDSKLLR